ncbi:transposable element Tcb1 transposase [Trichonephila clavipes]|nr:transposable element Tcb1 transposase [Trichonephila clavipes]
MCDRWMQEVKTDRSHSPQCTTSREDRQIMRKKSGLSARRPLLGLPSTQNHRRLLRQWYDERRMWPAEWNEVVFTDESRIYLQHHDVRNRVWRHHGETMLNSSVVHHHTGPASGIMPTFSPDISPMENMWSMVVQRLTQITPSVVTPDQLWQRVEAAWSAVPQEHIQSLFKSMPRRVAAVISNNGRHETGREANILQPPASVVSAATDHKTFGPADLTITYSVCTRRVFGGIEHRTQALRSGEQCSNH